MTTAVVVKFNGDCSVDGLPVDTCRLLPETGLRLVTGAPDTRGAVHAAESNGRGGHDKTKINLVIIAVDQAGNTRKTELFT